MVAHGLGAPLDVDLGDERVADLDLAFDDAAWWPNTAAWILTVSSTSMREVALRSSPVSPTWPPDSA